MTAPNLPRESAAAMSRLLEAGGTTPVALVESSLARIAALDSGVNAWAHLDPEGALAAAAQSGARQRSGRRLGPLDGVPVGVKDNLFVADLPARWGSRFFRDFVPDRDDIVVERLRAAGAIIIGKTTTPEFALSGRTFSPLSGHTRNPLDPRLTPGGSSGGAVASVAAGMVPLGIATDAGGSTRLPASYTGLFGLRPSNGRVARRYGFPPMALDFQAVGLIAATLEDLVLLYAAVSGPDPRDPSSQRLPPAQDVAPDRVLRIGWFVGVDDEPVDAATAASVQEVTERLAGLGCRVEGCPPPYELEAVRDVWGVISAAGVARMAARFPERWAAEASEALRAPAARGLAMGAAEYVEALDRLAALRADISARWGGFDALVMPSAASPAWPAEEEFPREIDGRAGSARSQNIFATWVNAAGLPGLSIPGRPHPDGRPVGIQLVGRFGDEAVLFEVARRLGGS